jgi:hypothetical protein
VVCFVPGRAVLHWLAMRFDDFLLSVLFDAVGLLCAVLSLPYPTNLTTPSYHCLLPGTR